jgi:hypothetical protein
MTAKGYLHLRGISKSKCCAVIPRVILKITLEGKKFIFIFVNLCLKSEGKNAILLMQSPQKRQK